MWSNHGPMKEWKDSCIDWGETSHIQSQNTLDDREDQNYVGNKGATKPTGVHLRKLEQGYMNKQRELEENHLA